MSMMKFLCCLFGRCVSEPPEPTKRAQEAPPKTEAPEAAAPEVTEPIGQTTAAPDVGEAGRPPRPSDF